MPIPDEFGCDPASIVGPLDLEKLKRCEKRCRAEIPHMKYEAEYVEYMQRNHGGIPRKQWFRTAQGTECRLGRFINFGGPYTPPYQDSWESRGREQRGEWSLDTAEAIANIAEGCGLFLIPFGILYSGSHHPDTMGLIYADLVCFNYKHPGPPRVVFWSNSRACHEGYRCQEEGLDSLTEMDLARFTEDVAGSFREFVLMLRDFGAKGDEPIPALDEAELRQFQTRLAQSGHRAGLHGFDSAYVDFLRDFNGCAPVKCGVKAAGGATYFIENFGHFAASEFGEAQKQYSVVQMFDDAANSLGQSLVPFAVTPFDDLVCFDYKPAGRPHIVVWSCELSKPGKPQVDFVSESFDEFLCALFEPGPDKDEKPFAALPSKIRDRYVQSMDQFTARNTAAADDIRALQGGWNAIARYRRGELERPCRELRLEFAGSRIREINPQIDQVDDHAECFSTFDLDVQARPRQLTVTMHWLNSPEWTLSSQMTFPWSYEVSGDHLRISRSESGNVPKSLSKSEDDYIEFKRDN